MVAIYEVAVNRRDDQGNSNTVAIFRISEDPSVPAVFSSAPDIVLVSGLRRALDELEEKAQVASGRPSTKASRGDSDA